MRNLEQNINQNEISSGSGSLKQNSSGDVVNDILKKFNEERKSRELAEEKSIDLEQQLKLISSDNLYLKDDLVKKGKEFSEEIQKYLNLKREFEHEFRILYQERLPACNA